MSRNSRTKTIVAWAFFNIFFIVHWCWWSFKLVLIQRLNGQSERYGMYWKWSDLECREMRNWSLNASLIWKFQKSFSWKLQWIMNKLYDYIATFFQLQSPAGILRQIPIQFNLSFWLCLSDRLDVKLVVIFIKFAINGNNTKENRSVIISSFRIFIVLHRSTKKLSIAKTRSECLAVLFKFLTRLLIKLFSCSDKISTRTSRTQLSAAPTNHHCHTGTFNCATRRCTPSWTTRDMDPNRRWDPTCTRILSLDCLASFPQMDRNAHIEPVLDQVNNSEAAAE